MTSAVFTGETETTFESIQQEFQQKAISLLTAENVSSKDLQKKIVDFANETFGAHPDLMRKEAEKRFKALPQFPVANLNSYVEHKSWDQFQRLPLETVWIWFMYGLAPEKLADMAKKTTLSRQLGPERYGCLALRGFLLIS